MILDFRFSIFDFGGPGAPSLTLQGRVPFPPGLFPAGAEARNRCIRNGRSSVTGVSQRPEIQTPKSKLQNPP